MRIKSAAAPWALIAFLPMMKGGLFALGLSQPPSDSRSRHETRAPMPSLLPVPRPPPMAMEPAVKEQLTSARQALDSLLSSRDTPPARLAQGFGQMGQLYLVYDLMAAAEAAFRNAHRLAPEEFRWIYLLGGLYQHDRRLDEAALQFEQALELRPRDLATLLRLAEVKLLDYDLEAAALRFAEALALDPSSAAAHYGLGRLAQRGGRHREAVEHFQAALRLQPQATVLHYHLGLAYRGLGEMDKMRAELGRRGKVEVRFPDPVAQGLQRHATGVGAHILLGQMAMREEAFDLAEEHYRKAVEINPESAAARQALGSALERLERGDEALSEFLETLRLAPDNPELQFHVGRLLAMRGEDSRAVPHLQAAVKLVPDYLDALEELARALERQEELDEASATNRRVLELAPDHWEVRFRQGIVLEGLGKLEEAAAELARVVAADAAASPVLLRLARLEEGLGHPQRALERYLAVLELGDLPPPQLGIAHFHAGNLKAQGGEEGAAMDHFEKAIGLAPDLAEAHLNLATLLGRQRRFKEAAARYQPVIEMDPKNLPARFSQALALLLTGEDADAARRLDAALALYPDEVNFTHLLARLLAASGDPQVRDGKRALELAGKVFQVLRTPDHAETLAMALAEEGRFADAVELQRQLVTQLQEAGRTDLLPGARRRLAGYERGEPSRSPWLE